MTTPILYSFRRCPYAMRARLALMHCGARCELREVSLKNKPAQMLNASSKGTVPVLILKADESGTTHRVIDESIDIMRWAMNENPLRNTENANTWQTTDAMSADDIDALINENDFKFKEQLDKYKYSDRHPEHTPGYYLEQAMPFLEQLDNKLATAPYLGGSQFSFIDAAILPFIRQFSMVDTKSFEQLALPHVQRWLAVGLKSDLFDSVMAKYSIWDARDESSAIIFGKPI